MLFTSQETSKFLKVARELPLNAPAERVEAFISRVLKLNAIQQGQHFPNPDPTGLLAIAVGSLTQSREKILRDDCALPTFAIYSDALGVSQIGGFSTYLASKNFG